MKKLLSILLAMSMLLSFVACGGDEADKEAKKDDKEVVDVEKDVKKADKDDEEPEALATAVVEDSMDAFCELNLKEWVSYFVDGEDFEDAPFEDKDDLKDVFLSELNEDESMAGMIDAFEPVFDTIIDTMLDSMTYEITDVSEDNGDFKFTVNFEFMDFASLTDFDSLMEATDFESAIMDAATELMESGDISEDMTEEEVMEALIPSLIDILEDAIVDALESVDTNEAELEFVVTEEDGKWLIDGEKSNIEELVEAFSGIE